MSPEWNAFYNRTTSRARYIRTLWDRNRMEARWPTEHLKRVKKTLWANRTDLFAILQPEPGGGRVRPPTEYGKAEHFTRALDFAIYMEELMKASPRATTVTLKTAFALGELAEGI